MTICFSIAGFWFLIFLLSFLYDRRLFRNSIFLVLALMFAGLGGLFAIAEVNRTLAELVAYGIIFLIPVTIGVLAIFLVVNGVTMLRREGRRPANLLSLAAGIGIFGLVIFGVVSQLLESRPLTALVSAITAVLTYVSFLFVCFLIYAFVYSRVRSSRK